MLANHVGENIPHLSCFTLNHFLSSFNCCRKTTTLELAKNKRLKEFQCHFLRQSTLVQTQCRANHDHRTARVVYALTEQVLTEATLLAFNHVGERLKGTLVRTGNRTATTAIIEKRIDRFLQHALLITHDNIRRIKIEQSLESIVTVDYSTIQVVEIRCGKTAAIEWHEWAQIWRQNRQHVHYHPLGLVS